MPGWRRKATTSGVRGGTLSHCGDTNLSASGSVNFGWGGITRKENHTEEEQKRINEIVARVREQYRETGWFNSRRKK